MVNAVLGPTLAAEFGLSAGGLGLLTSVYFLAFAFFQVPLGLLLDRYGPRRVNATLLLVAAAGGLAFAAAETASAAIAARALIGIGVSGCLMAAFTAYVLWYPPERLPFINGVTFSAGAIGAMVATVPLELLLRVLPWRQSFLLIVGATLAVSLVLWLWVPEGTARTKGTTLAESMRGFAGLLRDAVFVRLAVCLGASQLAAVSLQTLWIAPWLRDVAGYSPAQVARGLLVINVALIAGYLGFARAAEALARRKRDVFWLLAGGLGVSNLCLAVVVFTPPAAAMPLWFAFVGANSAVVLGYAVLSGRFPRAMAGRVNTGLNVFGFVGMFTGQWLFGVILDLWPQTPAGYAPEAYPWAIGLLWSVQLAGLLWLLSGRALFASKPSALERA